VHFYFGDRQSLVNAAWHEILMAHVSDDLAAVDQLAEEANWSGLAVTHRPESFTLHEMPSISLTYGPRWNPSRIDEV
jgi:hypothetical protein